jgi:hypothetical protein
LADRPYAGELIIDDSEEIIGIYGDWNGGGYD